MYLAKQSRPDIANSVRELAKGMSGASQAAMKELLRVIKFVLDTSDYGLKIQPNMNGKDLWKLVVYSDSDWAGDKDTRHSVGGYIMYLANVPILWKSNTKEQLLYPVQKQSIML